MTTVKFNVSGHPFEVLLSTIHKDPDNLLARIIDKQNSQMATHKDGAYFIDRNPILFPYILDYLRTGRIVYPTCVSKIDFLRELQYYGLALNEMTKKQRTIDDVIDVAVANSIISNEKNSAIKQEMMTLLINLSAYVASGDSFYTYVVETDEIKQFLKLIHIKSLSTRTYDARWQQHSTDRLIYSSYNNEEGKSASSEHLGRQAKIPEHILRISIGDRT